jgi:hypothetical protein
VLGKCYISHQRKFERATTGLVRKLQSKEDQDTKRQDGSNEMTDKRIGSGLALLPYSPVGYLLTLLIVRWLLR